MNTELPAGWTLSEPTQIFHAEWFRCSLNGIPVSLVLVHDHGGKWWAQNTGAQFDSAKGAILAAMERAGIGWLPVIDQAPKG